MDIKDCPMRGARMRLRTREETNRVPGTPETRSRRVTEWVCPECEHFEGADE